MNYYKNDEHIETKFEIKFNEIEVQEKVICESAHYFFSSDSLWFDTKDDTILWIDWPNSEYLR